MPEVRLQQSADGSGVGHHAITAALGRLHPNPERSMRGIEVIGPQAAQLLAAQPGFVGEGERKPVPCGLLAGSHEDLLPLLVSGNPGQRGQDKAADPDLHAWLSSGPE
jgi:hypothetical protein